MGRKKRNLALVLAAALVAAVAACSGPQSLGHDALGSDPASRLLSSSFRLAAGSIVVSGEILGIPGGSTTVQAVAHGGFDVQCTKTQGNTEPEGQFKLADSAKTETLNASRGAVRLGVEKKNETEYKLLKPAHGDPTDACPSPNNWEGRWTNLDAYENPVWIIEDVMLRFWNGSGWTYYSWTCDPRRPVGEIAHCGQGDGMPDLITKIMDEELWDALF
jgi:hypothetical protein